MKTMTTILMIFMLLPLAAAQAGPVSTAFTYQGRLDDNGGIPIDAKVDFQFYLHDAETGGSQIAGGYQFNDVTVENGVFSVLLNWTNANWNGDERWLEIRVRNPHDPTNTDPFVPMDPRQRITVVPYAIHALNGGGGGGSGYWTESGGAISNNNSGFVGIGRTNQVTTAEVFGLEGPPGGWGGMYIRSQGAGGLPFYGYTTDSYTAYHYLQGTTGNWILQNGGNLYFTRSGNLGVGIAGPTSRIEANGIIESTIGGFKFPDGTVQTTAGGGGGGSSEALTLTDGTTSASVELFASTNGAGTADGPILRMRNTNGIRTMSLFGGKTSGTDMSLYNAANLRTVRLLSNYTSGSGALLELKQGDGGHGVRIQAHGHTATAERGGEIEIYTSAGVQSLTLHGDYNNTGESRVVASVVEITGGADLSEHFDITAGVKAIEPGSVVSIDPASPGDLRMSTEAYDRKVAGIISGADGVKPGLLMGQKGTAADGEYPVALTGRVYCKVDASFGAIEPGDLLTTSPTPGHAMKVADHGQAQGAILGKAMTALEDGQGTVLVLVSLQ